MVTVATSRKGWSGVPVKAPGLRTTMPGLSWVVVRILVRTANPPWSGRMGGDERRGLDATPVWPTMCGMTSRLFVPPLVGHLRICETDAVTDPQLAAALGAYRRAEKTLDTRRDELFKTIGAAVVERGVRQLDIVKQTGYTREHVRRICKAYVSWRNGETETLKLAR